MQHVTFYEGYVPRQLAKCQTYQDVEDFTNKREKWKKKCHYKLMSNKITFGEVYNLEGLKVRVVGFDPDSERDTEVIPIGTKLSMWVNKKELCKLQK